MGCIYQHLICIYFTLYGLLYCSRLIVNGLYLHLGLRYDLCLVQIVCVVVIVFQKLLHRHHSLIHWHSSYSTITW